jgi:GTP-binding protein HflX
MTEEQLDELAALADTAGAEPVARIVQSRNDPDPPPSSARARSGRSTTPCTAGAPTAVILDDELSAGQLRIWRSGSARR